MQIGELPLCHLTTPANQRLRPCSPTNRVVIRVDDCMPYCNPIPIRDAAFKPFRVVPAQGASLVDGPRQQMIHKRLFSSSTVNEHPFWDKLIGCRPTVEISCRRKRVPALLTRSCPSERKYLISARSIIGMHLPGLCPGRAMKMPARTTSCPGFPVLSGILSSKLLRCRPIH